VAEAAGVSTATASRALGGYGAVSPEARERVTAAAASLGYRRNSLARSMITGTTHTIGLVVADIENPFFARAARGIADIAHRAGYEVLLVNSDEDPLVERAAVRTLIEKRVDGLIIAPASVDGTHHVGELLARHTPVVLIDRIVSGIDTDAVVVDNEEAARHAIEHLTSLGHRRIALLTSQGLIHTNQARLAGYLHGLEAAGIPADGALIRMAPYTREGAIAETVAVLELPDPPTAIFTTDNLMSLGAVTGTQHVGLLVPDQVSIVGFDDLEWTTIIRPALTVVAQPVYELGATAATRLIERIHGDQAPARTFTLATTFMLRGSTAAAPQGPREPVAGARSRRP
jgi:LacI family transcriptional regulator